MPVYKTRVQSNPFISLVRTKLIVWPVLLLAVGFGLVCISYFYKTVNAEAEKAARPPLARWGQDITIHAQDQGSPRINLSDGREVLTDYEGPAELVQLLKQNQAQPLAMASADFDEDGVPDLVIGYAGAGLGIVSLLRGNVDAIYPNSPEAQQRKMAGTFTDAPFLSPSLVYAVAQSPDFIGAGDFDGDDHWDVVAAPRGGDKLYLLSGDGEGRLSLTKEISLPGVVTALTVGEINRQDGLEDVVVGIRGAGGPQVLVFEGPNGALRAQPEVFSQAVAADALTLGHLEYDVRGMDLAITAGRQLMTIYGRDRRLSLDAARQAAVPRANTERRWLDFTATAIVIGRFSANERRNDVSDLAFLSADGAVHLLRQGARAVEKLAVGPWPQASGLARAHVSGKINDDLVVVDKVNRRLHIISFAAGGAPTPVVSLPVEGEPLAVLPMRLNSDALSDLVILRSGQSSPVIILTSPTQTYVVTNTNDDGPGSLRQAVTDANEHPGPDSIVFRVPGQGPHTITLDREINVRDTVTIDGTTQNPGSSQPRIKLNGVLDFPYQAVPPLIALADSSMVRGLEIRSFRVGVLGCIIEGNVITIELTMQDQAARNVIGGTAIPARNTLSSLRIGGRFGGPGGIPRENIVQGNVSGGIRINDSYDTVIGGRIPRAGNSISGVGIGISVDDYSRGTLVQGNDVTACAFAGMIFQYSFSGTIGGTTSAARNVISDNGGPGIGISLGADNLVQGNFIGTDRDGKRALPNKGNGVEMFDSRENTIGGMADGARNIISGNTSDGIYITGKSLGGRENLVQGNFIGVDVTGLGAVGNTGYGVFISARSENNAVENNRVAFNGKAGIRVDQEANEGNPLVPRLNRILSNFAFSNGGLGIDLGQEGPTANDDKDTDLGPNDLQNFPVLAEVTSDGKNTKIRGKLNSVPGDTFTIQFFRNTVAPTAGVQSGGQSCQFSDQTLLGEVTNVRTNGNGDNFFEVTFPGSSTGGYVNGTATSTDGSAIGNTSEFSDCTAVRSADLGVDIQASGDPLKSNDLTYCVTASNDGPSTASGVSLKAQLPANTTLKSRRQVSSCSPGADQVEGWKSEVNGANVTYTTESFGPGARAYFSMVVTVNARAPDDTLVCNAEISSDPAKSPPDPNPDNNRSVSSVRFVPPVDLSIALEGPREEEDVFEDEEITYTATVKNAGPPAAEKVEVRIGTPVGTTFRSSAGADGWRRADQTLVGGRGVITYEIDRLAPTTAGAPGVVFKVTVKVDRETPNQKPPEVIRNTASVSSGIPDRAPGDNSAETTTRVDKRPPGPIVQEMAVAPDSLTAIGIGFNSAVQVSVDDVAFETPAVVEAGRRVTQRGRLANGQSIADVMPPGKTVIIKFRNPDGGRVVVSFRN